MERLFPLLLCSKCGLALYQVEGDLYGCPKCKRQWTTGQGIAILHYKRTDGSPVYAGGAIEFKGSKKSGKKRKEPPRKPKGISNRYFDPFGR